MFLNDPQSSQGSSSLLLQHLFLARLLAVIVSEGSWMQLRAAASSAVIFGVWPSCLGSDPLVKGLLHDGRASWTRLEPFKRTFNDPVRVWPHEGPMYFYRTLKFWLRSLRGLKSAFLRSLSEQTAFFSGFISFMPTEQFLYKQKASFCRRFIYKDLFTLFYLQKKDQKEQRTYFIFTWTFVPTDQVFIRQNSSRTRVKNSFSFSLNQHHHLHKMFWKILQVSLSFWSSYKTLRGKSFLCTSWLNISGTSKEPVTSPAQCVNSAVMTTVLTSLHLHIHLNTEKEIQ